MGNNKKALGFIFATVLIDVIGIGLIIPIFPKLLQELLNITVDEASAQGGKLTAIYAAIQLFCAPLLGGLSDKYGRRPILLIALCGFGLDYFLQAWAPTFSWLIVGRVIAGITGSTFGVANSYIADVSTPENKVKNFGIVGAAFGVGFIIGPVLGALISNIWGIRAPFVVAGVLTLINFLIGFFVLPESLTKANRRNFDIKRANPIGAIVQFYKYPKAFRFIIALFLIFIGGGAIVNTWTYYTEYKFNWSELTVGISLGIVGLMVGLVQGLLAKNFIKKYGINASIVVGFTCYGIGCLLFGLAPNTISVFIFIIPYCLGGICQPALQSVISNQVPPNAQGELQGGITSFQMLSAILAPLIFNNMFTYFTSKQAPFILPGAPFYLGFLFFVAGLIIAITSFNKAAVRVAE
jgi:MFS transporter, DHA1 family, tetracycline resistance protein